MWTLFYENYHRCVYIKCLFICSAMSYSSNSQLGELGSGAGKGGGGGGSIREAGGAFGKMEAAHEEEYFYKQVDFMNAHAHMYKLIK